VPSVAQYIAELQISGSAVQETEAAFAQNHAGAALVAELALRNGRNPGGLFLFKIRQGVHLNAPADFAQMDVPPEVTEDEMPATEDWADRADRLWAALAEWRNQSAVRTPERDAELTTTILEGIRGTKAT